MEKISWLNGNGVFFFGRGGGGGRDKGEGNPYLTKKKRIGGGKLGSRAGR